MPFRAVGHRGWALVGVLAAGACATGGGAAAPASPAAARASAPAGQAWQATMPIQRGHQPTTEAVIRGRLEDVVREIPPNAQVPRIAMADVAIPSSQAELDSVGGYAAVLVTVICQDAHELPIDRVELRTGGQVVKLTQLGTHKSLLDDARLARLFGRFRDDAIFLIPVAATQATSNVTVFVGQGAHPLSVLDFPLPADGGGLPAGLAYVGDNRPPNPEALRAMIEREFPLVVQPTVDDD